MYTAVRGWPVSLPSPQPFGILQCSWQIIQFPVNDVLLLGEGFRELDLVVIQESGVGNNDDGDGDAEGVEDCAGACNIYSTSRDPGRVVFVDGIYVPA